HHLLAGSPCPDQCVADDTLQALPQPRRVGHVETGLDRPSDAAWVNAQERGHVKGDQRRLQTGDLLLGESDAVAPVVEDVLAEQPVPQRRLLASQSFSLSSKALLEAPQFGFQLAPLFPG